MPVLHRGQGDRMFRSASVRLPVRSFYDGSPAPGPGRRQEDLFVWLSLGSRALRRQTSNRRNTLMRIHGIIPPVATPMQANEDLDLPRLKWFLDHLIASGVHGVFVLGTNSEFYALDEREKQEVIATAVAHVNKRVPVYAGTGAETTREVVRLTRMAEREGADGVSVITPYFVYPTQQEIYDHYRRVAEHTSLPVVLYNNPSTCGGLKIDPETVARL